jgi:YrbI family 3-deoxy-D-manno-octulosonate 8-phosphate phosphatase
VPGKNLALVGGRPLVSRAIAAASTSGVVDQVVVTTDDDAIAEVAASASAVVVRRPPALASDTATSESALLHAIESSGLPCDDGDVLVFIQCTSPFIDPRLIAEAVGRVREGVCDVAFSAVPSHGFLWSLDDAGWARGVNHDASVRLRRQDRSAEYLETGAFYVMSAKGFVEHRHRFFGRVSIVEVDERHAIEIDLPADLAAAAVLAQAHDPLSRFEFGSVRALVTDFDGVHTDNRATVDQHGVEAVAVSRGDGMGISQLRRAGFDVLILSTEVNPVVRRRAEKLGIACEAGHDDKLAVLRRWADEQGLSPSEIAYLGNDINDLACLEWVGVPIVVADAHHSVASRGFSATTLPGGHGAVREVTDWLLAGRSLLSTAPQEENHS